jgi:hypothetical protein
MIRVSKIYVFLLMIIPVRVFSQNLLQENKKQIVDSVLSSRGEVYMAIPASQRKSFLPLIESITPDKQTDSLIYFYVNSEQYKKVINAGLDYGILTAPSMIGPVRMAAGFDEILAGEAYPTYQQYLDLMRQFSQKFPDLCNIDTIGYSIAGKLILAARLQRGQFINGDKPIVFYSATMHGDEVVGYSLMLMLINDILENAENSGQISNILDEMVLIINPLSNPDGTYFQSDTSLYGATRFNRNSNDLNRDFPDIRLGMDYSTDDLQKENQAMVKYAEKFKSSLSANFHGGAEVLNYPWDTWYSEEYIHADNDWFIEICKDYVEMARKIDPSYLMLYPEGYVFGSDWYQIEGGRQDFFTYCLRGRELTIELSNDKMPAVSEIPGFWAKNSASLINLAEKAGYGIFGIVKDSISMKPIGAKIEIPGYDINESLIYSHSGTGKFFRYLPVGKYNLQITKEGYQTANRFVEIIKDQRIEIEILLKPIMEILIKSVSGTNDLEIELISDDSEMFTAILYDLAGRKTLEKYFIGKTGTISGAQMKGIYILEVTSDYQTKSSLVYF